MNKYPMYTLDQCTYLTHYLFRPINPIDTGFKNSKDTRPRKVRERRSIKLLMLCNDNDVSGTRRQL